MLRFSRLVFTAVLALSAPGCDVGRQSTAHSTAAEPSTPAPPVSASHSPPPAPSRPAAPSTIRLASTGSPDPVLAALARQAVHGPAPRRTSASVYNVMQVWTRDDDNHYTGQRITSWRDNDGSGSIHTWTLPPSPRFTTATPGQTRFDNATSTVQTFGPGQMPNHTLWPTTLSADPAEMGRQLSMIWPIDTPADLLRALRAAHTRYVITREVRAAELTLLATTDGLTLRASDIPTHTADNGTMPGLIITAHDAAGQVSLLFDPSIGFLHAATEHPGREGRGRLSSYLVYFETGEHRPGGFLA